MSGTQVFQTRVLRRELIKGAQTGGPGWSNARRATAQSDGATDDAAAEMSSAPDVWSHLLKLSRSTRLSRRSRQDCRLLCRCSNTRKRPQSDVWAASAQRQI